MEVAESAVYNEHGLQVNFIYSSKGNMTEFGRGRSSTARQYIASSTSAHVVTVIRGDLSQVKFSESGGVYTPPTYGGLSTLSYDGTAFNEYYNDGTQLTYVAQDSTTNPVLHWLTKVQNRRDSLPP